MTKSGLAYYIIRDVTKNGKRSTETLKDLGTEDEIKEKYHCDDVKAWANEQAQQMNEDDGGRKVLVPYTPSRQIRMNETNAYNIGYLFLQKIFYSLRIDLICNHISKRHSFKYDLNDIMMKLVYERILHPSSKLSTYQQSLSLLEGPSFSYHDVPRALSIMAKEFDTIQAELYDYSKKVIPRNTNVLYYDCTNFFFEIDQSDDISNEDADRLDIAARKHGASKEHRPLPIVQMGLFMDYTGIPLAICLNRGNRNEQMTLIPLEEKIMSDFEISKFVVCTDAGLSSEDNRMFNNFGERSFVTTVSIKDKKIPKDLQDWCLEPTGWYLEGSAETYDIRHLEDTPEDAEKNRERIFYKSKLIEGYDEKRDITFNQTLFVTYSLKYRDYIKHLRESQIERASSAIEQGPSKIEKNSANDYKRFIKKEAKVVKTKGGKKKESDDDSKARIEYSLDTEAIEKEARFDGFYALETNLDDEITDILGVVKG